MLKRINRLTKKKDFDNVFKNGVGSYNKTLGVKAVNNNLEIDRFGIIVSTKVSKLAVMRNKIKRQIREIIKNEIKLDGNTKDFIIIALPPIKDEDFTTIKKVLTQSIKKIANIK